jgi:acetolactate synthase small subunit
MKKINIFLILVLLTLVFAVQANAADGLIKATSRFYFLQNWGESIRMFFTFSPDAKLNYSLGLADRRVNEINSSASSSSVITRLTKQYENHISQAEKISEKVIDKNQAIEKIREASLNQQQVLANVYSRAPEQALEAITNAQENSAKHVEKIISDVQGSDAAQKYTNQVLQIQQTQMLQRAEPVPMENSPNADPSQSIPNNLNEIKQGQGLNPLNPGQELKSLNPINELGDAGDGESGNQAEPVAPVPMQNQVEQQ